MRVASLEIPVKLIAETYASEKSEAVMEICGLYVVNWSALLNVPNNTFWALALKRKWAVGK